MPSIKSLSLATVFCAAGLIAANPAPSLGLQTPQLSQPLSTSDLQKTKTDDVFYDYRCVKRYPGVPSLDAKRCAALIADLALPFPKDGKVTLVHRATQKANELQCPFQKDFEGCSLFIDFAGLFGKVAERNEDIPSFGEAVKSIIEHCPGSPAGNVLIGHGSRRDPTGLTTLSVSVDDGALNVEQLEFVEPVGLGGTDRDIGVAS